MDIEKCKKRRFKKLQDVMEWEQRRGKANYIRFLKGERITTLEAIACKCYECECGWPEGVKECEVYDCPLLLYHPYQREKKMLPETVGAHFRK